MSEEVIERPKPESPLEGVMRRQMREAAEFRGAAERELKTLAECGAREYYLQCVVGIPSFGMVSTEFMQDMMNLASPINFTNHVMVVKGKPVAEARNEIAEYALRVGAKYVFFRDDDVLAPYNCLPQLAALAETVPFERHYMEAGEQKSTQVQCDIVSGMYWSKQAPPFPLIFRDPGGGSFWGWELGEVVQCVAVGMGLTLIKTEVFEKVPRPWFETLREQNPDGGKVGMTEDFFFCMKAVQAGCQVWCDTGLQAAHFAAKEQCIYGLDGIFRLPSKINLQTGAVQYWPGLERRKEIFRDRRGQGRRSSFVPDMVRLGTVLDELRECESDGRDSSGH